jgi:transcriptional regulator with XRE-family HTH domain
MQRFGEKLRVLRKRHGMTVRQLAALIGVKSHTHIVGLEAGRHQPSADVILKIAAIFDVTTDQLMKDDMDLDPEPPVR